MVESSIVGGAGLLREGTEGRRRGLGRREGTEGGG